ncbi:MAG: hypothetical protein A2Y07_04325 [Planctomycetes bacterium GWF2_50_10]|nr:MAG: hypothetical protein A2Y07_04325 [Planctomycetes bacterium GWF2_50_10]
MNALPARISLNDWRQRYAALKNSGMTEPCYGGPLERHFDDDDLRLADLKFDNSAAALHLWNFLLTEEDRLAKARQSGKKIIGTMKDLGTVPVLAYAIDNIAAFYPDGAWWIPCIMKNSDGLLSIADSLGIDECFCPVRAMLGAFTTCAHFPIPDSLICSAGAVCDDFSAIAQRLCSLGFDIFWWEMPRRRSPQPREESLSVPGGIEVPQSMIELLECEFRRIATHIENIAGRKISIAGLEKSIALTNYARSLLMQLRTAVFTAQVCPLGALEMLISEMLIIHFCSDRTGTIFVLEKLLEEVKRRVDAGVSILPDGSVKIFWVNPVADLAAMPLLEDLGGRICGTDYMITHALLPIMTGIDPYSALARSAAADLMTGPTQDRAYSICSEARKFGSEAVIISRIPGASHCATETPIIAEMVRHELGIPVLEIEVPTILDPVRPSLQTKIEALIETALQRRAK